MGDLNYLIIGISNLTLLRIITYFAKVLCRVGNFLQYFLRTRERKLFSHDVLIDLLKIDD